MADQRAQEWNPHMETAPGDGTEFQAMIPGHGSDNVIAWDAQHGGWFSRGIRSRRTAGPMATFGRATRAEQ